MRSFRPSGTLVAVALIVLAGCSAGNPTTSLDYRPPTLALRPGRLGTLRLPEDDRFSLHRAPTQRIPRLTGQVQVEADARDDGTARARTQVVAEGEGWAGFQVGHAVRNETARQIVLDVRIELDWATRVETSPQAPIPGADVSLDVLARDQDNRRLRSVNLLTHDSKNGPLDTESSRTIHWRLTLAPGDAVTLYVAGRTAGKLRSAGRAAAQRTVVSELQLRRLHMILTPEPSAEVRSDARGQDAD